MFLYFSMIMDLDNTKSITRYYKKTIPGVSGGLLLIEIGLCQPFYYIKLSGIERARITNQVENYKDKPVENIKIFIINRRYIL